MRTWAAFLVLGLLTLHAQSSADDLTYVSDEELTMELQRQQEDMARAKERLITLREDEIDTTQALEMAEKQKANAQKSAQDRIRLLSRLKGNGRAGEYLLGAGSAIELLKRLRILDHLVTDGLEEYGRKSAWVAATRKKLLEVQSAKHRTEEMLRGFDAACAELVAEQQRRAQSPLLLGDRGE